VRELLGPVLLLGLADSLNPATIAVAVLLAAGRRPVPRLATYTAGTGLTYFAGGVVLALGPAALLASALHPAPTTRTHVIEIVLGVGAFAVAAYIATRPAGTATRHLAGELRPSRSFLLGAAITVVDLPTALMYFGAIALVVAAGIGDASRVALLAIFNVAYVAPLIAVTLLVAALGSRAQPLLGRLRDLVARWGQRLLAALTVLAGAYLIAIGVSGLA
jgi:cytochrome c biogenesis protein CcdA